LQESHRLLQAIVEGTSDALWLKDLEGRYLMINSTGARWLGKSAADIVGRKDDEIVPPEMARRIVARDQSIIASGQPETFEVNSPVRSYLTTQDLHRDADGKVVGIIGIAHDITQLKRMEEQFRQAQKMEAVGRLAGGVAHDFNNLLTAINGYAELVLESLEADEGTRQFVTEIRKAGERAVTLTRHLLAFSRQQAVSAEIVDVGALLADLEKLLRRLIGEDVELALARDTPLGLVRIDQSQFEQAIINLAINARDAMPNGGRLLIEARNVELDLGYGASHGGVQPGPYVLVAVTDSGEGMDDATKGRLFEPFFTTKAIGKGTGLGLAMVYGFLKQSGGHVQVYSERGRGTTFKLYLPQAPGDPLPAEVALGTASVAGGTETVLLVEDESTVRALAKHVLESHGYAVLDATDGEHALEVVAGHRGVIELLVTDLVMPRLGGRQLAQALMRERPGLRVLFMSGYTDEAVLRNGHLPSGEAFLHKPFSPTTLARRVRALLDERR
jgi:PAS domain S-box-containing protein